MNLKLLNLRFKNFIYRNFTPILWIVLILNCLAIIANLTVTIHTIIKKNQMIEDYVIVIDKVEQIEKESNAIILEAEKSLAEADSIQKEYLKLKFQLEQFQN